MRKYSNNLILIIICSVSLCLKDCNASHLIGGYISYEHLSGNDYKINLNMYYGCAFPPQGDSLAICVKSNSLNYNSSFVVYYDTSHVLPYHPCLGAVSSCFQGGTYWGLSDNVYSCVITLPGLASDWEFSADICCRAYAPTTINSSAIADIYNYATLDNLNVPFNNSPQYNNYLMPQFCIGVFTVIDLSCTDPDGDSLVYEIDSTFKVYPCTSNSSYTVGYISPYTYLNFLASSTPITLNSATGALSFTPTMNQSTVYSIRVDEYRNGLKIGSMKRQEQMGTIPTTSGLPYENHIQNNLLVFPNPTSSSISVQLIMSKNISITDLLGETLIEKKTFANSTGTIEIDVSSLPPGIYFIQAGNEVGKFVKE